MVYRHFPQNKLFYNSMKKYQYLQSCNKLSQLQARLSKSAYICKTSLPTSIDAKTFQFLQQERKLPNRVTHPHLYHWYILMKQFSPRTVEIWAKEPHNLSDQDLFIAQYIRIESPKLTRHKSPSVSARTPKIVSHREIKTEISQTSRTPDKKSKQFLKVPVRDNKSGIGNKISSSSKTRSHSCLRDLTSGLSKTKIDGEVQIECVMEIRNITEENAPIREFKERLQEEKLKLVSLQGEEEKIRIVFKTAAEQSERLKDRISKWDQISNLQFRRQKKTTCQAQAKLSTGFTPDKVLRGFAS